MKNKLSKNSIDFKGLFNKTPIGESFIFNNVPYFRVCSDGVKQGQFGLVITLDQALERVG